MRAKGGGDGRGNGDSISISVGNIQAGRDVNVAGRDQFGDLRRALGTNEMDQRIADLIEKIETGEIDVASGRRRLKDLLSTLEAGGKAAGSIAVAIKALLAVL